MGSGTRAGEPAHEGGSPTADDARAPESSTLDALAELLMTRHLQISFRRRQLRDHYLQDFEVGDADPARFLRMTPPIRVIAVVGAGASAPVLGRSTELQREVMRQDPDLAGMEEEMRRLEVAFNQEPGLETALAAVARTRGGEERIRAFIEEQYSIEHPTMFRYEILAHLLKNRFLDAIVSFNFDELLDRSITDELSPTEYRLIASESDVRSITIDPDHESYVPCYVKPHGTASRPDTLRFTRDAYFGLPTEVQETLRSIMGASRCIVLNLGFGLASFDFLQLFDRCPTVDIFDLSYHELGETAERLASAGDRAAHVSAKQQRIRDLARNERVSYRFISTDPAGHKELSGQVCPICADERKQADKSDETTDPDDLPTSIDSDWSDARRRRGEVDVSDDISDHVLEWLVRRVEGIAQESPDRPISLQPIDRHRLVARMFGGLSRNATPDQYRTYLHDRTVVEGGLSLQKGRGIAAVGSLLSDRIGIYYDLYTRHGGTTHFVDIVRRSGMERGLSGVEAFVARDRIIKHELEPHREIERRLSLTESKVSRKKHAQYLARHLIGVDLLTKSDQMDVDAHESRVAAISELLETARPRRRKGSGTSPTGNDVELHSRNDRVCTSVFRMPTTIHTHTEMKARTVQILDRAIEDLTEARKRRRTDPHVPSKHIRLSFSASSGRFLRDAMIAERMKQLIDCPSPDTVELRFLVSFERYRNEITERWKLDGENVRWSPWWVHNRHMTVLEVDGRPSKAVYFVRRLRSLVVTPVYLWYRPDVAAVLEYFEERFHEAPKMAEFAQERLANRLRDQGHDRIDLTDEAIGEPTTEGAFPSPS